MKLSSTGKPTPVALTICIFLPVVVVVIFLGEGTSVVELAFSSVIKGDANWLVIVIEPWRSVSLCGHGLIQLK